MNPYICVTYAHDDREKSDLFCRGLTRYGFRHNCVNELGDPLRRGELLAGASLLIALTSPAAVRAETVASDIRHALERGLRVLCVSLEANELDHRFCTGTESGAALIPCPSGDTPDHHTAALFVHRLFVRHLTCLQDCFVEARCTDDGYGRVIRCAHYAHQGDGEACFELGRAYELGLGVPVLEKEAAYWIGLAADQNICDALIRMGKLRLAGTGIERDADAAFSLFSRAAELGDVRGVFRQGLCYLNGLGVMKDPVYAMEHLHRAACRSYIPALYELAILHRDGVGTEPDAHAALRLLYTVCRYGAGDCAPLPLTVYGKRAGRRYTCITMRQMRRTRLFANVKTSDAVVDRVASRRFKESVERSFGRNSIVADQLPEDRWERSISELYEAMNRGISHGMGDGCQPYDVYEEDWTVADAARAAYELGQLLMLGNGSEGLRPSPTRSLVWYRYAARLGYTEALYSLGDAYRRGYGIPANATRATELFRLAADGGSVRGQFAYAVCCERGIGRDVDAVEAVRRYERAAEAGYAPAQNNLGGCYEYGVGVAQNMVTAVEWYAVAANADQPDAMCRLGMCYEMGRGVSLDMDKAVRLYELAAEQGQGYALYRLALCHDRGDPRANTDHDHRENREDTVGGYEDNRDDMPTSAFMQNDGTKERSATSSIEDNKSATTEQTPNYLLDHIHAASLYREAADGGVPEAAYAMYLCHHMDRGVSRDQREEMFYLRRAAEGDCLQACYELGLCYLEGRGLPKDQVMAVACFTRAIELWRSFEEHSFRLLHTAEQESLPPDGLLPKQAAGSALYMLGYCTLYAIGEARDFRSVDLSVRPSHERVVEASALFREAADIDHVGALVMLGDLYAYGLLTSETATAEDESLRFYLEAVRVGMAAMGANEYRAGAYRDPTDSSVDALMSLAARALRVAEDESDEGNAEMARVNAWHSYSECVARGSADALVGMATCLFHGHGAPQNRIDAVRMLRRAETLNGGRVVASLWLGDALRGCWAGDAIPVNPSEADEVYLRGLKYACVETEGSSYTLGLRRAERQKIDVRARSEILYRLATLRAMYFSDASERKESFLYLAEAVLMDHPAAQDDLARIFAYEMSRPRGVARKANRGKRPSESRFGAKARLRRRVRDRTALLNRNSRGLRIHQEWMTDYYTALWPEPVPFAYAMRPTTVSADIPAYMQAPVTALMRVNALQYLGECFFEGYGLPADATAAVTCYRAVLKAAPKGTTTLPAAVTEATYSLGWCLLYGVGTTVDQPEAIRLLTQVSRNHAGACYTLGVCHEEGRGVVVADDREAIKFYRKAQKFGHPKAALKVAELEKRLQSRATLS